MGGGQDGEGEGPLAQVVQDQAGQHQEHPRRLDRPAAEVPHVRVEGFGPGDGQEHRAQHEEADHAVGQEELDPRPGAERQEDAGILDQVVDAERGDADQPDQADRPEQVRHPGRAPGLAHEQADEDDQAGDQHHRQGHVLADVRDAAQAFHRGEHRDRGRDQGVAVEQGRAADPQEEDPACPPAHGLLGQGHQGQDAALALVVRPHDHSDVFDGHHQEQGPERQGHHAQDGVRMHAAPARLHERVVEGIEGARPDVAEDDPDGAQGQAQEFPSGRMARMRGRPSLRRVGQSSFARHGR